VSIASSTSTFNHIPPFKVPFFLFSLLFFFDYFSRWWIIIIIKKKKDILGGEGKKKWVDYLIIECRLNPETLVNETVGLCDSWQSQLMIWWWSAGKESRQPCCGQREQVHSTMICLVVVVHWVRVTQRQLTNPVDNRRHGDESILSDGRRLLYSRVQSYLFTLAYNGRDEIACSCSIVCVCVLKLQQCKHVVSIT
jgi:hypothetical protein